LSRKIKEKLAGEGIVTVRRSDSWEDASDSLACLRNAATKLTRQRDTQKNKISGEKKYGGDCRDRAVSKINADEVQNTDNI